MTKAATEVFNFGLSLEIEPTEAGSADSLPAGGGWQYEPKWDSFRCLAFKQASHVGNNYPAETTCATRWASVQHYAELTIDSQRLILCRYPFRTWNQMGKRSINLHGHSHGRLRPMPRQFDVGVDPRDLHPRTAAGLLTKRSRRLQLKNTAHAG
ncbi:hypothetical protein [Rhizobium populisoli]|uniref:hypothetical protein n=1 Tax=Rhizobium populisoli TaxID=2859785 RepID=UPI0028AC3F7B|nr:hypothetical protein [Rhizobium populisoli]